MKPSLQKDDFDEFRERGMSPDQILSQIEQLRRGFPFTRLDRPCTVGDGITVLNEADRDRMAQIYSGAALSGKAMKFVPASGAASRMFKSLLFSQGRLSEPIDPSILPDRLGEDPEGRATLRFVQEIGKFAFYPDLKKALADQGIDITTLIARGRYGDLLDFVLSPKGLNLSNLPKGLIPFHLYSNGARTPFEEHLVEAALYVRDRDGRTRVHFTVSPEHKALVVDHLEKVRPFYENGGVRFELTVSIQEPSTDTIAVDLDNVPFRDRRGRLVFRPGGHGALLGNLNGLGDIVFIKNIDNVVPDDLKEDTVAFKMALGGFLVQLQQKIFSYLQKLQKSHADQPLFREVLAFLRENLSVEPPAGLEQGSPEEVKAFLVGRLNRPLRVCGMVKNEGEPGGGPYWVRGADGSLSIQIVESSQVDMNDDSQKGIWRSATHFNPVDLVCGLRDYRGRPFDLFNFVDRDTGFISMKSKNGRELKALELPGLWNGAMAFWNTAFVEVPSSTFSPVKTVLDLLRSEHRQKLA